MTESTSDPSECQENYKPNSRMGRDRYFSWRSYLVESDLYSVTKHVLLTLSLYWSERGMGIFPSINQIAKDCSLSRRAVITHIMQGCSKGWLQVSKHGYGDQRWKRNEYILTVPHGTTPKEIELPEDPEELDLDRKGGERGALPFQEGGECGALKVVNDVHSNTPIEYSKRESEPQNLNPEMATIPWMEKVWRNHPKTHKVRWPKIDRPQQVKQQEKNAGIEVFRVAWLKYLDTEEEPNLFAFLRDWDYHTERPNYKKQSSKPKVRSTAEDAKLWLEKMLAKRAKA